MPAPAKTTFGVSELVAEFGAYYQNRGQGQNSFIRQYSQADETTAIFDDVSTTEDQRVTKVSAAGGRVVQAFQKAFTPRGAAIDFKVHPIELFHFKIDELIEPDDIVESWLGFMEGLEATERAKWPLIRWIIEYHYKNQTVADIEEMEIFGGSYVAPTTGQSSVSGQSMDGIKKIINTHITNSRIAPLVLSSATPPTDPGDFVDWCVEFVRKIDKKKVSDVTHLNMSAELAERFVDGMEAKNLYWNKEQNLLKIPKTHVLVRGSQAANGEYKLGLRSFQGSNKVLATVKGNAAIIRRKGRPQDRFEVQPFDRQVKLMADWWFGIGFWVPEWVFTNAADLT